MIKKHQETLCWTCENSVPNPETGKGCSWSRKLIPVEGTVCDPITGHIIDCPEYIKDHK